MDVLTINFIDIKKINIKRIFESRLEIYNWLTRGMR